VNTACKALTAIGILGYMFSSFVLFLFFHYKKLFKKQPSTEDLITSNNF